MKIKIKIMAALMLILLASKVTAVPPCSPKANYGVVSWYYVMPRTKEIRFALTDGLTEASNSNSNEYSYPIVLTGTTAGERDFNKAMYESNLQMVINAFTTKSFLSVQTQDCLNPSPLPIVSFMIVGNIGFY